MESYPVLALRNTIVFPSTSAFLVIGRDKSVSALQHAQKLDGKIVVLAQKEDSVGQDISEENLYKTGTLCQIRNVVGSEKTEYQILAVGLSRFKVSELKLRDDYLEATGYIHPDIVDTSVESLAMTKNLKNMAGEILALLPGTEDSLVHLIDQIDEQDEVIYTGASYLKLSKEKMQQLLEEDDILKKMKILLSLFAKEKEVLLLEKDIREKVGQSLTAGQRQVLLREQLKAIKKELGETEEDIGNEYLEKIDRANMPESVKEIATEETKKLSFLNPNSSEYHVLRNYLDLLCQMPWRTSTEEVIDLDKCEKKLREDHYGLEKIKTRILEHLAVSKLKNNLKGPILCLYGPPGVGKTSLGKSIAESLGRKFIRVSLGGVRDESELRGHRRTYVGAMPGRIIQSIKRVEVNNPLILLDEIDKIQSQYLGDPASALLEILDPEQNNSFMDHYLDVPFDLSNVFFMATANRLDTIPAPLRDRMEIIELSSYTLNEKIEIGNRYIIPQTLNENGLSKEDVVFEDKILETIIERYTREAGVRDLKRKVASLCRASALEIIKGKERPLAIGPIQVESSLGPYQFLETQRLRSKTSGLVTGLAWTPFGGDVLYLECLKIPGSGRLKLTGQLGEVMKESAEIALSYVRSCLDKITPSTDFEKCDFHFHVPAGSIPKDGPSAGIGILVAIASVIMNEKVDQEIAMTGEITLSGSVLPVGGIKEKMIAANRYKIKKVIFPKENQKDLGEIPEEIKSNMEFIPVETIDQVLELVFKLKLNDE